MSNKSQKKKITKVTVPYNKVKAANLYFSDTIDNKTLPGQKLAFPRYKDSERGDGSFVLQGPWQKIDNYGIPKEDSPYHKTPESRCKIKLPLDARQDVENERKDDLEKRMKDLKNFKSTLQKIDQQVENLLPEILGSAKAAKKFEYFPLVKLGKKEVEKESDSDESDDDDKEEKVERWKPDYIQTKIDYDYDSKDITCLLYKTNKPGTPDFEQFGKRSKIDGVKTINDFTKYVHYMSKIKCVWLANKLWIAPKKHGEKKGRVGMTLKLIQVQVELYEKKNNNESLKDDAFIDSDSDDDDDQKLASNVKNLGLDSDEDDDDDNDDNDEEDMKLSEDDDDDDSEEEVKPKKKSKSKNKKKKKTASA